MTEVSVSTRLPAPVEKVWETVGQFYGLANWHPAVVSCESEDDGKTRRLKLADGSEILEELVSHDDGSHSYTYTIARAGPLPVQNYKATIRVDAEGNESKVTWSGDFEPTGDPEDARKAIENVYKAGFENLEKMFGMKK